MDEMRIDESMYKWKGQGLPHLSWIKRKPEPFGCELWAVCCVETGVMLHMEINEGAARNHEKEYHAEYGATTATTLRCCKAMFNTGRTIYGDSWFASYKTANALLQNGLYFVGNVKRNWHACLN